MKSSRYPRRFIAIKQQRGVLLIEALCAILIFSFGLLGLIGLQTVAIAQSGDAKFRSAAAMLADQYINQMWVANRTAATITSATGLQTLYASSPAGSAYTTWLGSATTTGSVMATLPGVTSTANLPTVTFGAQAAGCSTTATQVTCTSSVTVTIYWQSPHDNVQHNYVVNAQLSLY